MGKIIGLIGVVFCVVGGYAFAGGHLDVLWQPFEFLIIFGGSAFAYVIANPPHVLKETMGDVNSIFKSPKYTKEDFIEQLSMMFVVFKTARSKGWLVLEPHIEEPHSSDIFQKFPTFYNDHHAVTFLCDYLRLISLGADNPFEIEALLDEEIETQKEDTTHVGHAVQTMADGMPAMGIVAAVLGVIHTMGAIAEPPEVLGHLIGAALVGTFLGVLLSYGFVGPIASAILGRKEAELKYYICLKICMLSFLQGAAPQVAIEFGRKILAHDVRPTFVEVEDATQNVS